MHHVSRLFVFALSLVAGCGAIGDVNDDGDGGRPDRQPLDSDNVDDPVGPIDDGDDEAVDEQATPAPSGWSDFESEMLDLVNAFRTAGGACPGGTFAPVPPLAVDDALWRAARDHSEDMAAQDYFSHDGLDGSSFAGRIGEAGYTGQPFGENIAAGNGTAAATFEQWRFSDGHCFNMTTTSANEIGIGYASGGRWGSYWTQTFGRR